MRVGIDLLSERGTPGGIHTYTNEIARRLAILADDRPELGLELVFFTHGDYEFLFPTEGLPHVEVVRSRWKRLPSLPRRLYQESALPGLIRRHRVDVLHSVNNVLPLAVSVPSVLTVHDLSAFTLPERFGWWKQRYLRRRVPESIRRSTRVLTVSHSTRNDILTWVPGTPAEKVIVAHLAASDRFHASGDADEERAVRERYGLPRRFLLHVSLVERGKNLDAVSRALALLRDRQVVAPLVVVGSPTAYLTELRALWRRLGIADQVHYLGRVPFSALPPLYRLAEAFVFPSHYEGFGLPLLEAFACGTPSVTSSRSSLPEVAGNAALLVDPERPDHLMEAVRKVWCDEGLRALLRSRGLERSRQFSWERTARKTLNVYLDAAGSEARVTETPEGAVDGPTTASPRRPGSFAKAP
ncbi:MAG: glycosyltransferase family 1 protein [Planctomycetota bacterium]|nr:glycosyltransferase family 1 protein [Planctomycetota bacterium]